MWILEGSTYFPTSEFSTFPNPGKGVFNLEEVSNGLGGRRLGLRLICDHFEFPFKVYNLGTEEFKKKIIKTWNSEYFIKGGQNLGVLLTGTKGGGKSIDAKLLCNMLDLPVIIIGSYIKGMVDFISGLDFEAIILLDEAEKCWPVDNDDASQELLRTMDGAINRSRKLYILTTNTMDFNENLIGRPGRIRYMKRYDRISIEAVNEYLEQNLINKDLTTDIVNIIDSLAISTIDTLKALVDEANIHGDLMGESDLNLTYEMVRFTIHYIQVEDTMGEESYRSACDILRKVWEIEKTDFSTVLNLPIERAIKSEESKKYSYLDQYLTAKCGLEEFTCSIRGSSNISVGMNLVSNYSNDSFTITGPRNSEGWYDGLFHTRGKAIKVKLIIERS